MRAKRWAAALLCPALLLFCAEYPAAAETAAPPAISSLSAVVYEPESGTVLYEKDGRTARPMASTTKLMTALLASELLGAEDTVRVPAAALPVEGSQVGLAAGDEATVRDLLAALLLSSSNDAANALALLMADSLPAFAEKMNARAAALGMTDSLFVTPSGLDQGGHSASARDMALLGAAVLTRPLLAELCASKTAAVTIGGRRMTLQNHNKLLKLYAPCIGLKTGFTKKSGRCLVSAAQQDGVTLVIATLNGGDYWNDHMALYAYGFSQVSRQALPPVQPMALPVAGGTAATVSLTAPAPPSVVLRQGETVQTRVQLPAFVWAPVEAGQTMGQVQYTAGDRLLATVELCAAEAVPARPQPGFWALLWRRWQQLAQAMLQ